MTGREVNLSKADLCPSYDPANGIIRKDGDEQAPIAAEEFRDLLNRAMPTSEIDHIVNLRRAEPLRLANVAADVLTLCRNGPR